MQPPKLLPPHYFVMSLVLMGVLHFVFPVYRLLSLPWTLAGIALLAIGIAVSAIASGLFAKANTPVVPFERSTALVTGGLFRWTRNPMYLGLVLALVGVGIVCGTLGPFIAILVFIYIIRSRFIIGEERFLEGIFGDRYLAYKKNVRRWF
jgi:protein-S-isoprenylcysteine O-methyltransferase Ste14